MLLPKETRFALCYGIAFIAAMVLGILLSSGQDSLETSNSREANMRPDSLYREVHDGEDILMGHPALKKYMHANPQTDEIVNVLIAVGSHPSAYFAKYAIQYQAVPQSRINNAAVKNATEL